MALSTTSSKPGVVPGKNGPATASQKGAATAAKKPAGPDADTAGLDALASMGAFYFNKGDFEKALAVARCVLAFRDTPADQRLFAAAAHKNGDDDEALVAYEKCLPAFANDLHVIVNLAELSLNHLKPGRAAELLQRALELDPTASHPAGIRARALIMQTAQRLAR